jgi:hypothetical protein
VDKVWQSLYKITLICLLSFLGLLLSFRELLQKALEIYVLMQFYE